MKKTVQIMIALFLIAAVFLAAAPLKVSAYSTGKCGPNLSYTLSSDGVLTITGSGAMYGSAGGTWPDSEDNLPPWWYDAKERQNIKTVRISEGVTSIGTYAFADCVKLTNVYIPKTVTNIYDYAFYNCNHVASVAVFLHFAGNRPTFSRYALAYSDFRIYFLPSSTGWPLDDSYGEISMSYMLEVIEPAFTEPPKNISVKEGNPAVFTCRINEVYSNSTILWEYYIPGSNDWVSKEVSCVSAEQTFTLSESAGRALDGTLVRATITNSAGEAESPEVKLTVQASDPPVAFGNGAAVFCDQGGEASIVQRYANGDSATTVQWYYRTSSTGNWYSMTAGSFSVYNDWKEGSCELVLHSVAQSMNGYQFKAQIKNSAGSSEGGAITLNVVEPQEIPSAPVISVENALTGVKVSWAKATGAYKYAVFRKGPGETGFSKIGTTSSLSYTDTTVKNNTEYRYTVKSVSSAGKTSDYAAGQSIKYLQAPTIKAENALDGVKITWNKITGASKYYIYRKGPGETGFSLLASTANLTFTNKGVVSGNDYRYSVRAYPSTGKMSAFSVGYTVSYLKAPTITVKNTSEGVVISWAKITGASKYYVYRKGPGESGFTKIAGSVGLKLTDKTAVSGKEYRYSVRSVNSDATALSAFSAGQSIVCKKT